MTALAFLLEWKSPNETPLTFHPFHPQKEEAAPAPTCALDGFRHTLQAQGFLGLRDSRSGWP